jgi:carbon-monoxide dehydrogenase medium subunit
MKPPPFLYERATDLDHATSLLSELGDEARILAGGQSLLPLLNLRLVHPRYLIDISKTSELRGMESKAGQLVVGAGVTYQEVASQGGLPILSEAISLVGHEQIRNRGTLVGSIAHHDPSAELPAVALAMKATVRLASASGKRELSAQDFYASGYPFSTELAGDELVESVSFPNSDPGAGSAIAEHARRPGDFATAGVVCHVAASTAGTVDTCRIASFGGVPAVRSHHSCLGIAEGQSGGEELWHELAHAVSNEAVPNGTGSASYLRGLFRSLLATALKRAWSSAVSGYEN